MSLSPAAAHDPAGLRGSRGRLMSDGVVSLAKQTVKHFGEDRASTMAAAIAFYTALSFPPLVMLLVTIGGFLGEDTQTNLISYFKSNVGPQAAQMADAVVQQQQAQPHGESILRTIVSVALLLFAASVIFAQLQASLNWIWGVKATPRTGGGKIWNMVRKRLLSMGMILAMLFILLVAMVVSSVLDRIFHFGSDAVGWLSSFGVSVLVYAVLFAVIFKYLPDVHLPWWPVLLGALLTALLYALGQIGISIYMRYGGVGDDYGRAAGSLLAMLVWVYYSAMIFLFGAEATKAVALAGHVPLRTTPYSRWRAEGREGGRDEARGPAGHAV
jgi:membrane protein